MALVSILVTAFFFTPISAGYYLNSKYLPARSLLAIKASAEGLSEEMQKRIVATVECESNFIPQQSRVIASNGEREKSFGISQINLPSHPDITVDQAMDIDFSVDFIINNFKNGKQKKWTCYRKLFGSSQASAQNNLGT